MSRLYPFLLLSIPRLYHTTCSLTLARHGLLHFPLPSVPIRSRVVTRSHHPGDGRPAAHRGFDGGLDSGRPGTLGLGESRPEQLPPVLTDQGSRLVQMPTREVASGAHPAGEAGTALGVCCGEPFPIGVLGGGLDLFVGGLVGEEDRDGLLHRLRVGRQRVADLGEEDLLRGGELGEVDVVHG